MKTKKEIETLLRLLKLDSRNYHPIATIFVNAPLALIQLNLSSQINILEKILDIPLSKFPLIRQKPLD